MKVLEQFQCPKNNDARCEDALVVTNDFIAVIDGSTSKSGRLFNGKTNGFLAASVISETIKGLTADTSKNYLAKSLTSAIHSYYVDNDLLQEMTEKPYNRLTAVAVIYSAFHNEIWMIGDCQARVNDTNYTNNKIVDNKLATIRADADRYLVDKGYEISQLRNRDIGRELIFDALQNQTYFQNNKSTKSEYNYTVIDGFEIDNSQIKSIDVPTNSVVILASDGYPKIFGSLEQTEAYLQQMLKEDCFCIYNNVQTKGVMKNANSYDDRTYISFLVEKRSSV